MRIGIDLDGVIVDLASSIINSWNQDHGTRLIIEQIVEYFGPKLANVPSEYFYSWWSKKIDNGLFLDAMLYEKALYFLNRLKAHGHKIVIITSRDFASGNIKAKHDTIDYLYNNKIPYDELHFTPEKDHVYADIYLEDYENYIDQLLPLGRPILVPKRPWTKKIKENDIIKKYKSFEEAIYLIESIGG